MRNADWGLAVNSPPINLFIDCPFDPARPLAQSARQTTSSHEGSEMAAIAQARTNDVDVSTCGERWAGCTGITGITGRADRAGLPDTYHSLHSSRILHRPDVLPFLSSLAKAKRKCPRCLKRLVRSQSRGRWRAGKGPIVRRPWNRACATCARRWG